MADSKITKKRHPSGSLSRRILWIALILLVIPLVLQNFFLYRQEYQEKIRETKIELTILAKERVHLIQELIQKSWEFLDATPPPKFGDSPSKTSRTPSEPNPCAAPKTEAASESPRDHVKPQYKTPKTEALFGDPGDHVKPLYMERIPLPAGVADHFVLVSRRRDALLVGKKESNSNALIIPIPFSELIQDLSTSEEIRFALVDQKGAVVLENMARREGNERIEIEEPIPETALHLQITIPTQLIHGPHLKNYMYRFTTLLIFVGVLGGGAVALFVRRVSRPLNALCKTMERVSEGAAHARYTKDWMGFEINELGLQFNQTLDELLRYSKEAEHERIGRERLAEELRIGHDIQANLLPMHIPSSANIDLGTGYLASKEVSGDFYDFFELKGGRLLIAICDTAGKGISACLYSLGLRSILKTVAHMTTDLEEIVRKTNDLYYTDAHSLSMFSTLWLAIYDPKTRRLHYCSQGHPPALFIHRERLKELSTGGIALGAQTLDQIPIEEVPIDAGDLLVLYTDGVIEAHNGSQKLFGKERLHASILKKKGMSSQRIANELIEEVRHFSESVVQHDDITLLVIQFLG